MFSSNCSFLTCIQISQEAGQVVWYSHLFQNFPQFVVIHTVKGFSIVNKAEVDIFLEFSCFFYDLMDAGNLISASSSFSKSSLNIWKFSVHTVLKSGLENFEHYFANMWNECICAVVRLFFVIAFLWDWNENWSFSVLWPLLSFPKLLAQLYICMYLFSPKLPSHPGCHTALSRAPCAIQQAPVGRRPLLVLHCKCSRVPHLLYPLICWWTLNCLFTLVSLPPCSAHMRVFLVMTAD